MEISHDSVNRFLLREDYTPRDLFQEVRADLNLKGGTVSVDDSVLDKPYSHLMALVGYFWSGKHHRVVRGINLRLNVDSGQLRLIRPDGGRELP